MSSHQVPTSGEKAQAQRGNVNTTQGHPTRSMSREREAKVTPTSSSPGRQRVQVQRSMKGTQEDFLEEVAILQERRQRHIDMSAVLRALGPRIPM